MQVLFVTIACIGAIYFAALRKGLDFFTVGFFSSLLYFLPGFVGYDLYHAALSGATYLVFTMVLVAVVVGALLTDAAGGYSRDRQVDPGPSHFPRMATLVALAVVVLVMTISGPTSLLLPKTEGAIPGSLLIAWRVASSLAVIWTFLAKDKMALRVAAFCLLLTFVAHDRTGLGLTIIALLTEHYRRKGSVTLVTAARGTVLRVAVAAVVLFSGKLMHAAIQLSYSGVDILRVAEILISSGSVSSLISSSEPFATQAILEAVIRARFYIGPDHLLGAIYQIWPAPSMFGHESGAFNALYQGRLFPNVRSASMAYNFWAEGLASGGWLLLTIYIAVYVGGLGFFTKLSRHPAIGLKGLALLLGAYWAFYIHRNSLASILTYERHILYGAACIMACGWVYGRLSSRRFVFSPVA